MGTTNFEIEIEIFEGENCDHHQLGQKFKFPDDVGKICPWLLVDRSINNIEAIRRSIHPFYSSI
jgi:hypothetical protein